MSVDQLSSLAVILVVMTAVWAGPVGGDCWQENQANHGYSSVLSNEELTRTIAWGWADDDHLGRQILNMLVPRPPQSQGNAIVRANIEQELRRLGWFVEEDQFITTTLLGDQASFTNIIANKWPNSPRRLVLACHYDSKNSPEGFVGATDSAVPCAMLLNLAATLSPTLNQLNQEPELGLQLIFFDGEEQLYTNTMFGPDGLYGSKHLAEKYSQTSYVASPGPWCQSQAATEMDRIDILVLLDLIGAADPTFINSFFSTTDNFFKELKNIDQTLRVLQCAGGQTCQVGKSYFEPNSVSDSGLDDHTPFVERGMNRILHLISIPFPWFWHTLQDNGNNLDFPTITRITNVLRVFIVEYLRIFQNAG